MSAKYSAREYSLARARHAALMYQAGETKEQIGYRLGVFSKRIYRIITRGRRSLRTEGYYEGGLPRNKFSKDSSYA